MLKNLSDVFMNLNQSLHLVNETSSIFSYVKISKCDSILSHYLFHVTKLQQSIMCNIYGKQVEICSKISTGYYSCSFSRYCV